MNDGTNILTNRNCMKAQRLWFDESRVHVMMEDGKVGSLPIRLFPKLYNATTSQLEDYRFTNFGIRWEEIDEDLSYEGFFAAENQPKSDNVISKIFFEYPELNVRQVAKRSKINPTLLQQYIDGYKNPSEARVQEVIDILHRLGEELQKL